MKSDNPIFGCSQGRLIKPFNGELQCFPKGNWQKELKLASSCGLSYVELLAEEEHNNENPIWTEEGIKKLDLSFQKNNLIPYSICFDFIIVNSIFDENNYSTHKNYIRNLLLAAKKLNIKLLVLPLLKKSDFQLFSKDVVLKILKNILEFCKELKIEIALESIADSEKIIKILDLINDNDIGCVYDTGNRFSIEKPIKDIMSLKSHIKHIHLKDKRDGLNVPIGTGKVDFLEVFKTLKYINYKKYFNFETNRGVNPVETMKHNIRYIKYVKEQVY